MLAASRDAREAREMCTHSGHKSDIASHYKCMETGIDKRRDRDPYTSGLLCLSLRSEFRDVLVQSELSLITAGYDSNHATWVHTSTDTYLKEDITYARRIIDLSFVKYMKATLFTKEPAKSSFWLVRHHSHNMERNQGIEMKGLSTVEPGSLASPLGSGVP